MAGRYGFSVRPHTTDKRDIYTVCEMPQKLKAKKATACCIYLSKKALIDLWFS
jgi:hypothetical protein